MSSQKTMIQKILSGILLSGMVLALVFCCFPGSPVYAETETASQVAALYFTSSDPENQGISFVTKDHKASGEIRLLSSNGEELYKGKVDAIKGRGNTSWVYSDKKSYQIKLAKKADLLDPVSGKQKAKKWILLANPFDPTLVRNEIILGFAKEIGMDHTPEGIPIELYYDGDYRGLYFLCEKVETGDGRVEIDDLEKAIELANPDVDFDALTPVLDTDDNGRKRRYFEGYQDPEDISGGYLLEMDSYFYTQQESWMELDDNYTFAVKSPEYISKAQSDFISSALMAVQRCLKNEGTDPETGKTLFELIDKESAAKYFLICEWFMNIDTYYSSTYVYKKAGDEKLYFGPVWDFDASMGIRDKDRRYDYWYSGRPTGNLGNLLFSLPEFRQAIRDVYITEMRDKVFHTLIGDENGEYTRNTKQILSETQAAAIKNYEKWTINDCIGTFYPLEGYEDNVNDMLDWMENRARWFDDEIMKESFVTGEAEPEPAGIVTRYYGDTRYETSIKVADALKAQLEADKFDSIILASGSKYPDALAGSYLSCILKAPILLVDPTEKRIDAVQQYIRDHLKADGTIYILGGTAAVTDKTVESLTGFTVRRLWGATRYETNIAILKETGTTGDDILVVSGKSFADGLSASAAGKPILLVNESLKDSQKDYLNSLGSGKTFYIIGGTAAVSNDVQNELGTFGNTVRIGGRTRYETTVNVAKTFFNEPNASVLAFAGNFPDGLSGGVLANTLNSPLVLVANGNIDLAADYMRSNSIKDGIVLGGPALISDESVKTIFGLSENDVIQ